MTKFLNISTDNTLGGSSASDVQVSSQKAVKDYVDGKIPTGNYVAKSGDTMTGTLNLLFDVGTGIVPYLKFSYKNGNYVDLYQSGNTTLEFGANGVIANGITFDLSGATITPNTNNNGSLGTSSYKWASVYSTSVYTTKLNNGGDITIPATSGTMALTSDMPTVNNPTITITQGGVTKGSFSLNQASGDTIALDAGGGGGLPDQTGHAGEFLTTDGTDASWSGAIGYHPDLFDHKWADHICNDVQWLRADTFSWQSGAVYEAAYQHLVDDIDGKTLQSETVAGTTIQFYLADDEHKICPASQESNVTAIYNATGVAWYYIIDTTNQRFKLPRTKFGFTGIRSGVGNYVEAGLPNIKTDGDYSIICVGDTTPSGTDPFRQVPGGKNGFGNLSYGTGYSFDASHSSDVYGNSDTVQPKATEMYLYFYVGNFTQTATENTAGLNAELFNDKVDLSGSWGFPTTQYDNITVGASGSYYTAPADGWFSIRHSNATLMALVDSSNTEIMISWTGYSGGHGLFMPVAKGGRIRLDYLSGTTAYFRFVYAKKTN